MSCEGSTQLCVDALCSKTLICIKLAGNVLCFVLRGEIKSLSSSTNHEVVQYHSSTPCDSVVAWFKDYNNGEYHLLRVAVTSQSQQHTLSVSPIAEEERPSECPTALTFILDARGESASAMLNAVFPTSEAVSRTSQWFLIMSKKWWEDLLSSVSNVGPVGNSEDWESTRKSYVVEVVRAISSCGDINGGFITLVFKIASVAPDAGHQAFWMMEQLHGQHEYFCLISADPTSAQLGGSGVMTGQGQLATVPRNVTALKSTVSRKEPLAPTDVIQKYLPQENSLELCGSPPVNDIRNESTLQCPPPPSEGNSLSESTGSSERPTSREEDVDQEGQCEDVHTLALPCTEENPQLDELVENEDSHTLYLQSNMEFFTTPHAGSLVAGGDVDEGSEVSAVHTLALPCTEENPWSDELVENKDTHTLHLQPCIEFSGTPHAGSLITEDDVDDENQDPPPLSIECSEEHPAKDEMVENPDSHVPTASRGPSVMHANLKKK